MHTLNISLFLVLLITTLTFAQPAQKAGSGEVLIRRNELEDFREFIKKKNAEEEIVLRERLESCMTDKLREPGRPPFTEGSLDWEIKECLRSVMLDLDRFPKYSYIEAYRNKLREELGFGPATHKLLPPTMVDDEEEDDATNKGPLQFNMGDMFRYFHPSRANPGVNKPAVPGNGGFLRFRKPGG